MYGFLQLIAIHNTPIIAVKGPIYRNFAKHDVGFGRKCFVEIMHTLVEIIEEKIIVKMKSKKGAILHDGWTRSMKIYAL